MEASAASRASPASESLRDAVLRGDAEEVERMLGEGADPEGADGLQWCHLHLACRQGSARVVEALLRHGANPMARTLSHRLPTHFASFHNNVDALRVLLASGAVHVGEGNLYGRSHLYIAAASGWGEVSLELLLWGADPEQAAEDGSTPAGAAAGDAAAVLSDWVAGVHPVQLAALEAGRVLERLSGSLLFPKPVIGICLSYVLLPPAGPPPAAARRLRHSGGGGGEDDTGDGQGRRAKRSRTGG